jgi:Domain of unknown function (DUF4252)
MRLPRIILLALLAVSATTLMAAQQQPQPPSQPPLPSQSHDWTPRGIEVLRQGASSKTEFTLDHSMLALASKLDPDNEDLRRVIAGVNGVSVHSFRYPAGSTYDSAALLSLKEEYRAAGWKQVMHDENVGGHGVTNVWLRLENNAISNAAVLIDKRSEVDFIAISGSISPLDLSHLGGHFGIPKIEGGVKVPNTAPHP